HARRAGRARRPKSGAGLNELAEIRAKYQVTACIPAGSSIDREGHSAVNVREIRAVEKVVRLPAELKAPLFTKTEILEERQVCIEDRGKANQISLQIADIPRGAGRCKARSVNQVRRPTRISRASPSIWITGNDRSRCYVAASEVSDGAGCAYGRRCCGESCRAGFGRLFIVCAAVEGPRQTRAASKCLGLAGGV